MGQGGNLGGMRQQTRKPIGRMRSSGAPRTSSPMQGGLSMAPPMRPPTPSRAPMPLPPSAAAAGGIRPRGTGAFAPQGQPFQGGGFAPPGQANRPGGDIFSALNRGGGNMPQGQPFNQSPNIMQSIQAPPPMPVDPMMGDGGGDLARRLPLMNRRF